MKKIYEHIEFSRVGHFQSILECAGIESHIKNQGAATAAGEIPFTQCYPELWVADDQDYERSLELLTPYYAAAEPEESPWICPNCRESIDASFGQCWNCQAMKPRADSRS